MGLDLKKLKVKEKLFLGQEATMGTDTKISGINYNPLVKGKDQHSESNVKVEMFGDKLKCSFLRYN